MCVINSRCVARMCVLVRFACARSIWRLFGCVCVCVCFRSVCEYFVILSIVLLIFLQVVYSFYNMLVLSKVNFRSTHYSLTFFVYEKDHICSALRIIKTLNYNNTKQRRLTQGMSSKYFTIVIVVEVVYSFVR